MAYPIQPAAAAVDYTSDITGHKVVVESRSTLYSDIVWRKRHRIFSKQRITLQIEEVERKLENGSDCCYVELIGYTYQSKLKRLTPSFRLDLSNQHWEHQVDPKNMNWQLSIGENENYHQTVTFHVASREQLVAWTAQFHQCSNYYARDILSRSYHIILPKTYSEALSVSVVHCVLSCWSENDSVLVAKDPSTGTLLQMWDIRQIDAFSVDLQSFLGLRFILKAANDPPIWTETVLEIPFRRTAEKLFLFFEAIVSRKVPRCFALLTRRVMRAVDGVTTLAISYDYDFEEDSTGDSINSQREADEQLEKKSYTEAQKAKVKDSNNKLETDQRNEEMCMKEASLITKSKQPATVLSVKDKEKISCTLEVVQQREEKTSTKAQDEEEDIKADGINSKLPVGEQKEEKTYPNDPPLTQILTIKPKLPPEKKVEGVNGTLEAGEHKIQMFRGTQAEKADGINSKLTEGQQKMCTRDSSSICKLMKHPRGPPGNRDLPPIPPSPVLPPQCVFRPGIKIERSK